MNTSIILTISFMFISSLAIASQAPTTPPRTKTTPAGSPGMSSIETPEDKRDRRAQQERNKTRRKNLFGTLTPSQKMEKKLQDIQKS